MSRRIPITEVTPRQMTTVEKDVRFFRLHPGVRAYERPATKTEQRDFGLPPHAICFVVKLGAWQHIRAFRVPGECRN